MNILISQSEYVCLLSFAGERSALRWSDLKPSCQFAEMEVGERGKNHEWKKTEVALCLHLRCITYVHLIYSTLRRRLPARFNQISSRNQCPTSYRACKTCFPTSVGYVINHVEIKVKREGCWPCPQRVNPCPQHMTIFTLFSIIVWNRQGPMRKVASFFCQVPVIESHYHVLYIAELWKHGQLAHTMSLYSISLKIRGLAFTIMLNFSCFLHTF